jgi:putative membrane protein
MNKFLIHTTTVALGLSLWTIATAQPSTTVGDKAASHVTMAERSWVGSFYNSNSAAISLGKLAASRAENKSIREFGGKIAAHHGILNKELKMLADKKGIKIAMKEPVSDHQSLSGMSGKNFDKAFVQMMITQHTTAEKRLKSEAKSGNDPNLKAWAGRNLEAIQAHLKFAQAMKIELAKP